MRGADEGPKFGRSVDIYHPIEWIVVDVVAFQPVLDHHRTPMPGRALRFTDKVSLFPQSPTSLVGAAKGGIRTADPPVATKQNERHPPVIRAPAVRKDTAAQSNRPFRNHGC